MKIVIQLLLIFIVSYLSAQEKHTDKIIFSFITTDNSRVDVLTDTSEGYLRFKISLKDKIQFQFPDTVDSESSWKRFTYSYYIRGGGRENEGLDLNYLYFTSGSVKYVIYDAFSASEDKYTCGYKTIDPDRGNTNDYPGKIETRKGSLMELRDNKHVNQGEEMFD